MKTLVLIRHGKAVNRAADMTDHQRSLVQKGIKDSRKIARLMKDKGIMPDVMISSPALRALETAKIFAQIYNYSADQILLEKDIYDASRVTGLISLIKKFDDRFQTVFIFGHEPTLSELTTRLVKFSRDTLPKSGAVGMQFRTDQWKKIRAGQGKLYFVEFPKGQSSTFKEMRLELDSLLNKGIHRILAGVNDKVAAQIDTAIQASSKDLSRRFIKKMKKAGLQQVIQPAKTTVKVGRPGRKKSTAAAGRRGRPKSITKPAVRTPRKKKVSTSRKKTR